MPGFASIILRFRDLSTPAGTTTIEQHKRIIDEKGYVWWGWWHKQGETVPESAFREILAEIGKSGPYQIYLFDTGKYRLQRASLSDIRWDTKLTPTPPQNVMRRQTTTATAITKPGSNWRKSKTPICPQPSCTSGLTSG